MEHTDILIVGAGPTGLHLAYNLRRLGVPCRIIDRSPEISPHTRAVAFTPRTQEIFEQTGLLPVFRPFMTRASHFNMIGFGRIRMQNRFSALPSKFNYAGVLIQPVFEQVMTTELQRVGGVSVERSTELLSFSVNDSGVTATLASTSEPTKEAGDEELTVRAKFLVGCDGTHSTVRKQMGWKFLGKSTGIRHAHADVAVETSIPHMSEPSIVWNNVGALMIVPLGNGKHRVTVRIDGLVPDGAPIEAEELLNMVRARVEPQFSIRFKQVDRVTTYVIHERMAERYNDGHGRVFIAGDAAHCHSPMGGRGMNTGLQDAHNLAWKLALLCHGVGDHAVLAQSFATERRPIAEHIIGYSGALTRQNWNASWLSLRIRAYSLPLIPKSWINRRQLENSDLMYRYSAGMNEMVQVGRRLPYGTLRDALSWRRTSLQLLAGSDAFFGMFVFAAPTDIALAASLASLSAALRLLPCGTDNIVLSPVELAQGTDNGDADMRPRPVKLLFAIRVVVPSGFPDVAHSLGVDGEWPAKRESILVVTRPDGIIGFTATLKSEHAATWRGLEAYFSGFMSA
ncbi:FAD binding domain-containing protein [Hirsutella rhossiliensis]|uniref:FAD binding domain-containing protein n=1 Tax=Hirsutella rhossiliensis TaxID=111463 RepID=A0A9P8MPE7_9HYPO|nr:FAD binding domain-containing protein [Hirsutella rhossiliensis]KAH0959273.1 FAD binding domain-containing protein [Hirsutella rhossiliensis]